jgi:hypothetical protein
MDLQGTERQTQAIGVCFCFAIHSWLAHSWLDGCPRFCSVHKPTNKSTYKRLLLEAHESHEAEHIWWIDLCFFVGFLSSFLLEKLTDDNGSGSGEHKFHIIGPCAHLN